MAQKRQKKRTHTKVSEEELAKIPRSMVIRLGSSLKNHSLTQLMRDFRHIMQPHTAINLRERKSNKLKDFIVMAGPLGVSHLMIFNQNEKTGNNHLRISRIPRGPTLHFKINTYSLNKDVNQFLRHPKSLGKDSPEFLEPPLLVLNGFNKPQDAEPYEKLIISTFQNMFPPISPQQTKVSSIKRVLMINRDKETGEIDIRHYAIDTKLVEVSKNVKKLINAKTHLNKSLPNLSKVNDVSDLILDPYAAGGYTSESEVEDDAVVEIQNETTVVASKKGDAKKQESAEPVTRKRAIKLTELGPRMNLSLVKIEEGIFEGKVLHHEFVSKSDKQIKELEKRHQQRTKLKQERRAKQQENIKEKNKVKEEKKLRRKQRREAGEKVDSGDEDEKDSGDEMEIDPADYANDSDLYSDIEK